MDRVKTPDLHRERFQSGADAPAGSISAATLLQVLLHQDGSTTRLLEMLVGSAITVHVLVQGFVDELPPPLANSLAGKRFLRRLSTLEARGHVLLDSISYTAIDALPASVARGLLEGVRPIGHVFSSLWTKRSFGSDGTQLLEELWSTVGEPHREASRSCVVLIPEGPCMLLAETIRQGIVTLAAEHCGCQPPD